MPSRTVRPILGLSVLLVPFAVQDNDGVFYGSGGAVVPSRSTHVRMVAEEVILDMTTPREVHGTCIFVFENTGPTDTLLVGFPDFAPQDESGRPPPDQPSAIRDLLVTVDGERVETRDVPVRALPAAGFETAVPEPGYDRAHVWPCVFEAGETRVLRTEYRHVPSATVWDGTVIPYVLTTGASWAGTVGKVVVRLRPGPLRVKYAYYPECWTWTGEEYVWVASELEPSQDIRIGMDDPLKCARTLTRIWQRLVSQGRDPRSIAPGEVAEIPGYLGGPDYYAHVREALGDSIPALLEVVDLAFTETAAPFDASER